MKKCLLLLLCAVLLVSAATAQEVSEKKEIAVFSLSYSDWSIPTGALAMVDQQIVAVLTNLGRFIVRGTEFRLDADDVSEFIDRVKAVNEANMVIDEKYRLGEETFSEADFEKLVGSFIIVIPSLTYYNAIYSESTWKVELQTAFSFVLVKDSTTLAQFTINTYGGGDDQQTATLNAAEAISSQLEFELRSIEEFQLKSGIIEVLQGGNVIMELGSGMGLKKGDEFSIQGTRILASGHTIKENTGLLVVSEVKNDVSYGRVIYSKKPLTSGAQLGEVPRMGSDVSVYGRTFIDIDSSSITGGSAGLRAVVARGFYDLRPFVGVEIPIVDGTLNSIWPGIPVSIYGGGELLWYFGRLQIEPSIAIGGTGLIPVNDEEEFILTHVGGTANLTLNWMFLDNMRFFLEGGYSYWVSLVSESLSSVSDYGGFFAGLGVTFKL